MWTSWSESGASELRWVHFPFSFLFPSELIHICCICLSNFPKMEKAIGFSLCSESQTSFLLTLVENALVDWWMWCWNNVCMKSSLAGCKSWYLNKNQRGHFVLSLWHKFSNYPLKLVFGGLFCFSFAFSRGCGHISPYSGPTPDFMLRGHYMKCMWCEVGRNGTPVISPQL